MNKNQRALYKELVACLKSMVSVYRSLLKVVRQEREILTSANLDELNENNRSKEAFLIKSKELENIRIELSEKFAECLGLPADEAKLLSFSRQLGGDEGDALRNIHSVLELLLKRISELNKKNEALVQSALVGISGAMTSIRDTLTDKPTYEKKGKIADAKGASGRFVSREA